MTLPVRGGADRPGGSCCGYKWAEAGEATVLLPSSTQLPVTWHQSEVIGKAQALLSPDTPNVCSDLGRQHGTECQLGLELLGAIKQPGDECVRLAPLVMSPRAPGSVVGMCWVEAGKLLHQLFPALPHPRDLRSPESWLGHWTPEQASAGLSTAGLALHPLPRPSLPTLLTLPT